MKIAKLLRKLADKLDPPVKLWHWQCPTCHKWGRARSNEKELFCNSMHKNNTFTWDEAEEIRK